VGRGIESLAVGNSAGPTIFDAMGQLGLKLEPRKLPMPVIAVTMWSASLSRTRADLQVALFTLCVPAHAGTR
jgi:hypothetical protein